jgi:hypothetical protein
MHGSDSFLMGAMGAAIKVTACLHAVPDDFAAAVLALRGQCMNGTFKTIEIVRDAVHHNLQGLVVFISANLATIHGIPFS